MEHHVAHVHGFLTVPTPTHRWEYAHVEYPHLLDTEAFEPPRAPSQVKRSPTLLVGRQRLPSVLGASLDRGPQEAGTLASLGFSLWSRHPSGRRPARAGGRGSEMIGRLSTCTLPRSPGRATRDHRRSSASPFRSIAALALHLQLCSNALHVFHDPLGAGDKSRNPMGCLEPIGCGDPMAAIAWATATPWVAIPWVAAAPTLGKAAARHGRLIERCRRRSATGPSGRRSPSWPNRPRCEQGWPTPQDV